MVTGNPNRFVELRLQTGKRSFEATTVVPLVFHCSYLNADILSEDKTIQPSYGLLAPMAHFAPISQRADDVTVSMANMVAFTRTRIRRRLHCNSDSKPAKRCRQIIYVVRSNTWARMLTLNWNVKLLPTSRENRIPRAANGFRQGRKRASLLKVIVFIRNITSRQRVNSNENFSVRYHTREFIAR